MSEWLTVHGFLLGLCLLRQSVYKFFKSSAVFGVQFCFKRIRQSSPQCTRPAFALIVQVSTPSSNLTGQVNLYSISGTYDAQHLPFGQNFAATDARPLWNMFDTLGRFLCHLRVTRKSLFPVRAGFIFAAFVDLASNHCAEVFVKL